MRWVLAIDPAGDAARSGWAYYRDRALAICGIGWPPYSADVVVVERPQIYPMAQQKGDPNDLISVALFAGRLVQSIARQDTMVIQIHPRMWKGQVPKPVHNRRVIKQLSASERVVYAHGTKGIAPKKVHNVIDAIGIGLWRLGRVRNPRGEGADE